MAENDLFNEAQEPQVALETDLLQEEVESKFILLKIAHMINIEIEMTQDLQKEKDHIQRVVDLQNRLINTSIDKSKEMIAQFLRNKVENHNQDNHNCQNNLDLEALATQGLVLVTLGADLEINQIKKAQDPQKDPEVDLSQEGVEIRFILPKIANMTNIETEMIQGLMTDHETGLAKDQSLVSLSKNTQNLVTIRRPQISPMAIYLKTKSMVKRQMRQL